MSGGGRWGPPPLSLLKDPTGFRYRAAHGIAVDMPEREEFQFRVDYRANLNVTNWNGRRARLTLP